MALCDQAPLLLVKSCAGAQRSSKGSRSLMRSRDRRQRLLALALETTARLKLHSHDLHHACAREGGDTTVRIVRIVRESAKRAPATMV